MFTSLTPTTTRPGIRPSYFRSLSSSSLTPQSNKPRLYLALYARGGGSSTFHSSSNCDSFHWALVVGPQSSSRKDPGTRYHINHNDSPIHPFLYEESDLHDSESHIPLIRITLAKVRDQARLTSLIRSIPVPSGGGPPYETCLDWTRSAFQLLASDRGGSSGGADGGPCLSSYLKAADWEHIETKARKYVKRKKDMRRFDRDGPWDRGSVSTWNFWENRETTV